MSKIVCMGKNEMSVTLRDDALIALGGNLPSVAGDPEATLRAALARLEQAGAHLEAVSQLYRTPCFPAGAGPDYVNAAARLRHDGKPMELLELLHQIEAEFGRERAARWGGRTLDLDLIAVGDQVLPDAATQARWQRLPLADQMRQAPDRLILPHPRMQDRAFVLVPLCDVASQWRHPVLGRSVAELTAALPPAERKAVVAL